MVEHSNVGVGEGTLESEKWWNIIMTVVAVKVVDYRIVIYFSILIRVLPKVLHICYHYIQVYDYTCTALCPTQVLFII
jgi:hypothetical protein